MLALTLTRDLLQVLPLVTSTAVVGYGNYAGGAARWRAIKHEVIAGRQSKRGITNL